MREAKSLARERAARYERLLELKKVGFTSKSGLVADRMGDWDRKIARTFKEVDKRYIVSEREASLIPSIQEKIIAILTPDEPNANMESILYPNGPKSVYPISYCMQDYAHVRFEEGQKHPKTQGEIIAFTIAMLKHRFGNADRHWKRIVSRGVPTEKLLPGHSELPLHAFFSRIRRENGLLNSENQRNGVILAFDGMLKGGHINELVRQVFQDHKNGPSKKDIEQIKSRVEGFDKKPKPVRERIIQERFAQKLGGIIATEMIFLSRVQQRAILKAIARNKDPKFPFGSSYHRSQLGQNAWLIRWLKKKSNHRVLIQKAIEWASEHPA